MDIEEKVKIFEKSCEKLAEEDSEKLNKKIDTEISEQIDSEIVEYEKKQENSYRKQCEKIEKEYHKEIYNYEIECKKNINNIKEIIKNELKNSVLKKLNEFTNTIEYGNFLSSNIKKALEITNFSTDSVLYVTEKDLKNHGNIINNFHLSTQILDNSYIGGCKLENKNLGICIDNTLATALKDAF